MNEQQISSYLSSNPVTASLFLGTLAYDELPYKQQKDGFYIVNTGHSSTAGNHWIVTLRIKDSMEYFDSLAHSPIFYSEKIEEYLFRNSITNTYKMNSMKLQGDSNLCGNYCILYGFLRAKKYTMISILKLFSNNLEKNDILVKF